MSDRLDDDTISDRLPDDWTHDDDAITRTYTFEEYLDGVAFASEVGDLADEAFHHPEITIRYDEVEVRFTDHEAGGVTSQDIELARRTDDRR
ncbi:4a-hydroxytetrahydrobiopterin dehydratase [Halobacterium salinarum]|uniref:4a-hydroxytetrahydrobiopterin dehydratase n=1 Tax=Halobacterium salinarum TaxID=2242 RepID=UPI0025531562|nr:4a-hydroxytetrahydrobiopterin dehydratase [Halobacterium salinarum]MDL0130905.1 4a-hydroxytetrahydrobiopterin dehydratase [Halobacterium salinarum]